MKSTQFKGDNTKCENCGGDRFICDESFSYEILLHDGKVHVDTNDYCTDGFENFRCRDCDSPLLFDHDKEMEY